jgi:quercetin dioxygenase-like cupin family protein
VDANLKKLEELTEDLFAFPKAIDGGNGYREYQMEEGECFGKYIHRSGNKISIHRWFNSKGIKFPEHAHESKEWIIVYEGSITIKRKDGDHVLNVGDFIVNNSNQKHSAVFPTSDCKYITVTIPSAKEFPDGSK